MEVSEDDTDHETDDDEDDRVLAEDVVAAQGKLLQFYACHCMMFT